MASSKLPQGSSASQPGGRPRAQVSYEGDDEFSAMSLDPSRKKQLKEKAAIAPDTNTKATIDELKPTNDQGIVGLFRKIFAK